MILYAMIVRAADGMTLSASIENDNDSQVRDTKRHLKQLSKQVKKLPDRCTMPIDEKLSIYLMTTLGVSYITLCENSYPVVLAFSFLDELVKEFITSYTTQDVNMAMRPYSFLQFDNFIQKTRQRYNNPSSLVTKLNLADLSLEVKLRPPHQLSLHSIEPVIANGISKSLLINAGIYAGPALRQPPINWMDFAVILLTVFCSLFNFVRGISALSESSFEDYDGTSPLHGLLFIGETAGQFAQIFLLLNLTRRHFQWASLSLLTICLCNIFVYEIRDLWQILVHVGVAMATMLRIVLRKPQRKPPNHNV